MSEVQTLGQRIAAFRKGRGLTQEDVAGRLGISAQAVSKWENDVTCPDISLLPALADLLEVTVDVLLRGETEAETYVVPETRRKPMDELLMKLTFDTDDGDKLRMNLPVGVLKALISSGVGVEPFISIDQSNEGGSSRYPNAKVDIDWESVMRLVERGVVGKLVEFEAEGAHLSIWVE